MTKDEQIDMLKLRCSSLATRIARQNEATQEKLKPYVTGVWDSAVVEVLQSLYKAGKIDSDELTVMTSDIQSRNPFRGEDPYTQMTGEEDGAPANPSN